MKSEIPVEFLVFLVILFAVWNFSRISALNSKAVTREDLERLLERVGKLEKKLETLSEGRAGAPEAVVPEPAPAKPTVSVAPTAARPTTPEPPPIAETPALPEIPPAPEIPPPPEIPPEKPIPAAETPWKKVPAKPVEATPPARKPAEAPARQPMPTPPRRPTPRPARHAS